MLRRLLHRVRPNSAYDVMAAIACFGVLAGGTAYAANTIRSTDIVDGEVRSADIRNDDIQSGDVKDNSINTFDVHSFLGADVADGTLTDADIQDFSLGNGDYASGSVNSRVATDNSLTGTDINEATLSHAADHHGGLRRPVGSGRAEQRRHYTKVVGRDLPAGSYAITATANYQGGHPGLGNRRETNCELRNGSGFIGGASDRRDTSRGPALKDVAVDERRRSGSGGRRRGEPVVRSGRPAASPPSLRPDDDHPARRVLLGLGAGVPGPSFLPSGCRATKSQEARVRAGR